MKYTGKLYGKVGRKTIPLMLTSSDVDTLEAKHEAAMNALKSIRDLCNAHDGIPPLTTRWESIRRIANESANAPAQTTGVNESKLK